MSGSIVDTNVIIKMLNNNLDAIKLLEQIEQPYVTITVIGELFYGAQKSSRKDENMALFKAVLSKFDIIDIDELTAQSYAIIKADLVSSGINIPENDLWIAASAHRYGLSLATFDSHFNHIKQIEVV